ncbi:MAG: polysaccharide biosynthesis tyrosine autokinase [Gammaproteobacteria bacterium]|nr:polysaccharide biosynthesis tyrosine autokinase [Gammaproteobacteria bacterium]
MVDNPQQWNQDRLTDREYDDSDSVNFRHYLYILDKHKWAIVGLVFAAGLLATVLAYSMQPIYKSTTTLLIGGSEHLLDTGNSFESRNWAAREQFFATQVVLLKSREIAEMALEQLDLLNKPDLNPLNNKDHSSFNWRQWLPASWIEAIGIEHTPAVKLDPQTRLLRWLNDNLYIASVRDTTMVKLSFESPNSKLAATVANTVSKSYIDNDLKRRLKSTKEASEWLEAQLEKSQQNLVNAVGTLQRYRESEGLLEVQGMESVYAEQLKILASEIGKSHKIRMEAENIYLRSKRLNTADRFDSLPVVFNNPWLQRLKQQEEELERQIQLDSDRFQGDYPGSDEAQQKLKTLQSQINAAVDQIVVGLKTDYEVAVANQNRLQARLNNLEKKVQGLNSKEFQAKALVQVVSNYQQSYETLLSKMVEITTRGSDTISLIARIVDPAIPGNRPEKPKKLRIIGVSIVLSLFVGIGLALLLERLDNTIKSREEVEDRLKLPLLGELAKVREKTKSKHSNMATEFRDNPKSIFAEAIRTIRTSVALSALDSPKNQVLAVTSTVTGEGKSTTALNLAFALGSLGNVLLIDADLRRPSVAKNLGLDSSSKGLTDLVQGTVKISECIHHVSGDIHVLPAGSSLPSDPLVILASGRFSELLNKLSTAYDTVIIDTAPVELVSDALILATKASGLIYVIKAGVTSYKAVRHGINNFTHREIPILGVVLNHIENPKAELYAKHVYGFDAKRYAYYRSG